MTYLVAFLIFLAVAAVTWAVALYQSWVGGPDLRRQDFAGASALAIGLVALASFIPHLPGYLACLAVWGWAARGLLGLPWPRAAALSFVSRLAILGALQVFWPEPPAPPAAPGAAAPPSPGPWAAAR